MNIIRIADRTLTEVGQNAGASLSFKEKIEVARHLDNLNVDVIELPEIENVRTDTLLVRTISSLVKYSRLSMPVGMTEESLDIAWKSINGAAHPRLRVELPISPVQMEYICHKKAPKIIDLIDALVRKAASLCSDVEFYALDATRAEPSMLIKSIETAINAGATTITVCDNAATMMPDDFVKFIVKLKKDVPSLENVKFGVYCENKFGMAPATVMMALRAATDEVKTSVSNRNAPSLDMLAEIIRNCGEKEQIGMNLKYTEMRRITKQIAWITERKHNETSPFNAAAVDIYSEYYLSVDDDISVITGIAEKLGYDLSDEDKTKVYEEFKRVAGKKKITSKELDAIIASVALQVPPTYKLVSYLINSGNIITASAHIKMKKNDQELEGICLGDGPIDASFLAIEQIIGHHYELDDFRIKSVTEGYEAMGSALVRLRNNGKVYSGNGISTDIVGASIRAYISALNKIAYEEI